MFKESSSEYRLNKHVVKLMETSPFFAEMARRVRKVVTDDLPTAGVTFDPTTDDFVLGVNPEFMSSLTDAEVAGILRHEFYHIVFMHVTTRRKTPHMRWNVATDLAINSIILDPSTGSNIELPEGALIPGRPLSFKAPALKAGEAKVEDAPRTSKEYKAALAVSDLIASFPVMESSEYYFSRLSALAEQLKGECPVHGKKKPQKGKSPGESDPDQGAPAQQGDPSPGGKDPGENGDGGSGGEDGEGGHEQGDGHGGHEHGDEGEECTCGGIDSMDDHSGWDSIPEEMREYVEAKAKELTEKAVKHADSQSNGWGSIPASVRDEIRRMVSRTVDWKSVLRQFVGSINRGERTSTVRRINRKYPYIHPGVKRGYTAKLAIAIDQSGSVGDEMLAQFFAELETLTRSVSVTVIPFDYDVDEKNVFEWKKGQRPSLKRAKAGGTSFDAPTAYVNDKKNRGRWDGVIFLTDGECSKPMPSRIKRGWILAQGHKLYFDTDEMQVSMEKGAPVKGAWR